MTIINFGRRCYEFILINNYIIFKIKVNLGKTTNQIIMKTLLVLFFTFCLSASLFSQTVIKGQIKDAKTGEPMLGVNIVVVGSLLSSFRGFKANLEIYFIRN